MIQKKSSIEMFYALVIFFKQRARLIVFFFLLFFANDFCKWLSLDYKNKLWITSSNETTKIYTIIITLTP